MIENISKNLISLKKEFRRVYCGTSHVQEIMPLDESDDFPIPQNDLDSLHIFLQNNSIYYDKFESTDNTIEEVNSIAKKEGYIKEGDMLINLASMPISNKGMVNTMRISQL